MRFSDWIYCVLCLNPDCISVLTLGFENELIEITIILQHLVNRQEMSSLFRVGRH